MKVLAVIDIRPFPQPRINHNGKWKHEAQRYFAKVRELQQIISLEKNLDLGRELDLIFVFAIPKSWSQGKRGTHYKRPHLQTPDLSNCIKAFEDALYNNNHPLGLDDKEVYSISALKVWGKTDKIIILEPEDKLTQIQGLL
jgi:Holliday junction resolvase RusA-like endonuclease